MTHRIPQQDIGFPDETIRPLEYSVHGMWADALGLKHIIRGAHPDEIEAVRREALEAADMIRSYFEVKQ
jgi:hypothetical protein